MLSDKYLWILGILGIKYNKALKSSKAYFDRMQNSFDIKYTYNLLGTGSYRTVFQLDSNWVIKFPLNSTGVQCNLIEARIYEIYKTTGHYAKCYIKNYRGIPLIVMENIRDYFDMAAPPLDFRAGISRRGVMGLDFRDPARQRLGQ